MQELAKTGMARELASGRARGDRGRDRGVARGVRGLLARHAQPADGQPRCRGSRHRLVRAGPGARRRLRRGDDRPGQRAGAEGGVPRDAGSAGTEPRAAAAGRRAQARARPKPTSGCGETLPTSAGSTKASPRCTRACASRPTTPRRTATWRATTGWGRATSTLAITHFRRALAAQPGRRLHAPAAGAALRAARRSGRGRARGPRRRGAAGAGDVRHPGPAAWWARGPGWATSSTGAASTTRPSASIAGSSSSSR